MNTQLCVRCGEFVTMTSGAYRQITGWEEVRKDGGANKIVDRETTGQVLHHACMVTSKHHPGQGQLI